MFTGIVQSKAQVLSAENSNGVCHLTIAVEKQYAQQIELGASIAINGVCLTVVKQQDHDGENARIDFDVIDETLRVTNLSSVKSGDYVNFERSLKVGDEIGGHQVSGHIHALATVTLIEQQGDNCSIHFTLDENYQDGYAKYLFGKGFVSINGTSLTLGESVENGQFNVHLIPETLTRTNIGELTVGDKVNIEMDQQTITIVSTIERMKLKLA
ncbi:riboflavin synthase subunit alpha [Thalassotalea euphylliae]|uniref:Riboflavin synthase n=1 Tax=Thalassotalea euphylliae TaxID=1655234 RepID=A0A3E0TS19_9GAMM|nr:riboflavin synthase subunit alpha [Thalassotalea euphylliae]REL26772.1 riboflavin synthase subunit alpha [Thalassotalea euphylliae]